MKPRINDPPSIAKFKSFFSQGFLNDDNRSCSLGHDHKIGNMVSSFWIQKEHNFVAIFRYLKRVTLVVRIYWFILYFNHGNLELLVHLKGSSFNFSHWSSVIVWFPILTEQMESYVLKFKLCLNKKCRQFYIFFVLHDSNNIMKINIPVQNF